MEDNWFDIAIVGGGIVGAAAFYKIQKKFPNKRLVLIEKEDHLAGHQTGHNSGVIHSGLYYKPGSSKAMHCVAGRRELVQFCAENKVAHDVCGKVVAACDSEELPFMDKIFENGLANGTEGIQKITADELREIEPFVESIGGIWVPCTGIVDFVGATQKMVELALAIQPESVLRLGEKVEDFSDAPEGKLIKTDRGLVRAKHLVVCGGLFADRLARKDGVQLEEKVVGFRGDYYELADHAKHKVKNLIYPVPNPAFPFLGVHFTRMTNGEIECGPNAVFTFKREGYGKTDFSLRDTVDALSYKGTRKLFAENFAFGLNEYRRAFSKRRFLKTLQRLIPSLEMNDLVPGRSGVRAMLLNKEGDTRDDFRIEYKNNSIHVLNAPSPAATSSLAIGDSLALMVEKHFEV